MPKGRAMTKNAAHAAVKAVSRRIGPWCEVSQPASRFGAHGWWRGPEPERSRCRLSSTAATMGMSTTPNCGFTNAAAAAKAAAPSLLPRMSAARPNSRISAPAASVWPHSAES